MAIERAMTPIDFEEIEDDEDVLVELPPEEGEEEIVEEVEAQHFDNLANTLSDDELTGIASKVIETHQSDMQSRSDWATSYASGLDLMGMKVEDRSKPWPGASGVFHPILTETVIRFQAQAMGETMPPSGPAKTKIIGKHTRDRVDRAQRVQREMNFQTTEKMTEYRDETERLLFHLPLAGSAFKKIYYDPVCDRPKAIFVPAEDLIVSYGASDLESAERYTHVMKKPEDELLELMAVGFYSGIELGSVSPCRTDIQEKYDELSGQKPAIYQDSRHTLLEQHVMLRLEGDELPLPYVVTVHKDSQKVLAVRRNWDEADPYQRKLMHFVHYRYLPGMGFYGTGLIHLLGGLTKTATSILRQLIDAGTLANLPAGLKARGLRIKGDNTPFMPGEFRDVDVTGQKIADSIAFLPYKEPSTVLHALLGDIVNEARRIGSVADTESGISSANKEMPVGTTFALLEQQMKVMSGVQARIHAALHRELKLLKNIIRDFMDETYEWDEDDEFNRLDDFRDAVDVIPVSDPNTATAAQRVVSYQAALQLAQSAPNIYDLGKLHRQMLETLGIDNADELVKLPDDLRPMDPVTENMAVLKQEPIKAFLYQDHEAHIRVHMAAAEDPKIQQMVGQSPFAGAIQSALAAHITEHVAFAYRKKIEEQLGVPMPDPEAPLPEDVELELSRVTAEAAGKLLELNKAEAAEQEAQKEAENPLTQIQMRELEIKERRQKAEEENLRAEQQIEQMKIELEAFKHGVNMGHMRERLNSEEARAAGNLAVKIATTPSREDQVALTALRMAMDQARMLQDTTPKDRKEE